MDRYENSEDNTRKRLTEDVFENPISSNRAKGDNFFLQSWQRLNKEVNRSFQFMLCAVVTVASGL